jgi:LysM repeat protein
MIVPSIDQISAVQLSDDKIEIKAEVSLDVIAFANEKAKAVLDMEVKPIDFEKKKELPGITCYIVKEGDTLWSIAKRYYTTVERIKETNGLESDLINVGDKLVIIKE